MTNTVFADMLARPRSLGQVGRETAQNELPRFLRAVGRKSFRDERSHAVLLCLAAGLRRAASQHLPDLGGAAHAQRAAEELERLLNLTRDQRREERKRARLAPRYTARKTDALDVIGALFEVRVFTEAARRIWCC